MELGIGTSPNFEGEEKDMKINQFAVAVAFLIPCAMCGADVGAIADAYVDFANAAANFGGATSVRVSPTQTGLMQFDVSSVPSGAVISRASLVLFVSGVTTPGAVGIFPLVGPWN